MPGSSARACLASYSDRVGTRQQQRHGVAGLGDRDADAAARVHDDVAGHRKRRLLQGPRGAIADLARLCARHVGEQDDELVAADARDDVDRPDGDREDLGDPAEERIARRVPVGVVHVLEVIDVDGEHARRRLLQPECGVRALECSPVERSRQRVARGEVPELLLVQQQTAEQEERRDGRESEGEHREPRCPLARAGDRREQHRGGRKREQAPRRPGDRDRGEPVPHARRPRRSRRGRSSREGAQARGCSTRHRRSRGRCPSIRYARAPLKGSASARKAASGVCRIGAPPLKTRRPNGVSKGTASATIGNARAADGTTFDTAACPPTAVRRCA